MDISKCILIPYLSSERTAFSSTIKTRFRLVEIIHAPARARPIPSYTHDAFSTSPSASPSLLPPYTHTHTPRPSGRTLRARPPPPPHTHNTRDPAAALYCSGRGGGDFEFSRRPLSLTQPVVAVAVGRMVRSGRSGLFVVIMVFSTRVQNHPEEKAFGSSPLPFLFVVVRNSLQQVPTH